ncbi:MAG TPA: glucose-6-phosphate isomerase [Casimicrobiaceae bacterium]|jgi:glucose-6-phosphate isomerase
MNTPHLAPASHALQEHRTALAARTLSELFAADADRFARLSLSWDQWLADWSKQRVTPQTMDALVAFAHEANLPAWIAALFNGEKINLSEGRPALHTALRQADDTPLVVDGSDVIPLIRAAQARVRTLASQIRGGLRLGASGRPLRHVIALGIGGSDLGPKLVCDALALQRDGRGNGTEVAFVSNVDPEHLTRALVGLDPATTLFVVTSKTFTTAETLANAHAARGWLASALGAGGALAAHFIAITGNDEAARAFGIAGADILPVWDWVGGRYSLWSPVGLPIAIRCGWDAYAELLAGAASIDRHFREAPLESNLPVLLALVDYWNARMLGYPQRIVVPYAEALKLLPSYLQQLTLESNGKSVLRDGTRLDGPTAPALWGSPGTDGQHAFFQWLHQGTSTASVEFIVPVRAAHPLGEQQTMLIANALAQAQALLRGKSFDEARAEVARGTKQGAPVSADALAANRVCPGNRPSTVLLLPELNARRLGQLIALFEHRTFVEGVLLGINSFDQWGVELGKALAAPLFSALKGGVEPSGADASTLGLAAHVNALNRPR